MKYTTSLSDPWVGYTAAALQYLCALEAAGHTDIDIDPVGRPFLWSDLPAWTARLQANRTGAPNLHDVNVGHYTPHVLTQMRFRTGRRVNLGLTVTETDPVPSWIMDAFNRTLDGVICPTQWQADIYARSGLHIPTYVVPHALDEYWWRGVVTTPPPPEGAGPYVFYTTGTWNARKNPIDVLRAYLRGFVNDGTTALALKVTATMGIEDVIRAVVVAETGSDVRLDPTHGDVWVYAEAWPDRTKMQWLHAHVGHCYVSAHRGEGWGYGLHEAAAMGRPVIYTSWSAPVEFLDPSTDFPVEYTLQAVGSQGGDAPYFQSVGADLMWADPCKDSLIEQMRDAARRRAVRDTGATSRLRAQFAWEAVGAQFSAVVRQHE